ncbi:MAG: DUF4358 domain-containing protein [Oscillospiraceae bacterium]
MKKTIALMLVLAISMTLLASCSSGSKLPEKLDVEKAVAAVDKLEIMPAAEVVTDQWLKDVAGIDAALVEKYHIAFPMMIVHSSLYMLILPKQGSEAEVKKQTDAYMKKYDELWAQYLPDQSDLVKNRLEENIETKEGTWQVIVIASDTKAVMDAIKSAVA